MASTPTSHSTPTEQRRTLSRSARRRSPSRRRSWTLARVTFRSCVRRSPPQSRRSSRSCKIRSSSSSCAPHGCSASSSLLPRGRRSTSPCRRRLLSNSPLEIDHRLHLTEPGSPCGGDRTRFRRALRHGGGWARLPPPPPPLVRRHPRAAAAAAAATRRRGLLRRLGVHGPCTALVRRPGAQREGAGPRRGAQEEGDGGAGEGGAACAGGRARRGARRLCGAREERHLPRSVRLRHPRSVARRGPARARAVRPQVRPADHARGRLCRRGDRRLPLRRFRGRGHLRFGEQDALPPPCLPGAWRSAARPRQHRPHPPPSHPPPRRGAVGSARALRRQRARHQLWRRARADGRRGARAEPRWLCGHHPRPGQGAVRQAGGDPCLRAGHGPRAAADPRDGPGPASAGGGPHVDGRARADGAVQVRQARLLRRRHVQRLPDERAARRRRQARADGAAKGLVHVQLRVAAPTQARRAVEHDGRDHRRAARDGGAAAGERHLPRARRGRLGDDVHADDDGREPRPPDPSRHGRGGGGRGREGRMAPLLGRAQGARARARPRRGGCTSGGRRGGAALSPRDGRGCRAGASAAAALLLLPRAADRHHLRRLFLSV
mmetsp:Transcript_33038/g.105980  ORF Transcript_33038/g.105980 Transcript_33038/m.105980 type:complete len:606 (+) Transcript_33038:156-1973(+)